MTDRDRLAVRLRTETAELHRATEERVNVPAGIATLDDYARLLCGMSRFHRAVEDALHDRRWRDEWTRVGVRIADHDRSTAIANDRLVLGHEPDLSDAPFFAIDSFAQALGCLYVVEGSSLGGRFIGPMLAEHLGDIPLEYYSGTGRNHPLPWRSLQSALRTYEHQHDGLDDVVVGAVRTFGFFAEVVSSAEVEHEPV